MEYQKYLSSDFAKAMKPERISVAERFRRQNLPTEDLLTGDMEPLPRLPPPLVPLPFEPLTKSQILSLYDKPFAFLVQSWKKISRLFQFLNVFPFPHTYLCDVCWKVT